MNYICASNANLQDSTLSMRQVDLSKNEELTESVNNANARATGPHTIEDNTLLADLTQVANSVSTASVLGETKENTAILRRVSFPKNDNDLVTGYMEPANPWTSVSAVHSISELTDLYKASCDKHKTEPLQVVLDHLRLIDLKTSARHNSLSLKENKLTPEDCEALEEIFKRVQYRTIDISGCNLNDIAASALFDMIEYYEAANELDISDNPDITTRGWQSCISMIRRSRALQTIIARGIPLSEITAGSLGKSLNTSCLSILKLEHCGLTGRPLASLCNATRRNTTLRELWLANNDLSNGDAEKLSGLLRMNMHLQFLDISNNHIQDLGVRYIVTALIEQSSNISESLSEACSNSEYDGCAVSENMPCRNNHLIDLDISTSDSIDITNTNLNLVQTNKSKYPTNGRSMLDALLNMNIEKSEGIFNKDEKGFNNNTTSANLVKCSDTGQAVASSEEQYNNSVTENIIDGDSSLTSENKRNIDCILQSQACINIDMKFTEGEGSEYLESGEKAISTNNNMVSSREEIGDDNVLAAFRSDEFDENKNANPKKCDVEPICNISYNLGKYSIDDNLLIKNNTENKELSRQNLELVCCDGKTGEAHAFLGISQTINVKPSPTPKFSNQSGKASNVKLVDLNDTFTEKIKSMGNSKTTRGLQAIVLWNNNITRESGEYISDLLAITNSLEFLNIGKNVLSNDFVQKIKDSLKQNTTLINLGLQSAHLTGEGIKLLSSVLQFGGNSTLQRIDIRDNNVQVDGLVALCDALKSNKSITRIDIDDVPKRLNDEEGETHFYYSRALQSVRTLCARNVVPPEISTNSKHTSFQNSRKISLTCQSIRSPVIESKKNLRADMNTLDTKRKSSTRLRSPLPSPPTSSPSSSPVPSPSRSRFQVFRVVENPKSTLDKSEPNLCTPNQNTQDKFCVSPNSRFHVTVVGKNSQEPLRLLGNSPEKDITSKESVNEDNCTISELKSLQPLGSHSKYSSGEGIPKIEMFNDDNMPSTNENFLADNSFNLSRIHSEEVDKEKPKIDETFQTELNSIKQTYTELESTNKQLVADSIKGNCNLNVSLNKNCSIENKDDIFLSTKEDSLSLEKDKSIRKVSRIPPSNYPKTVDKLLSLFQNPTHIFSRPSENEAILIKEDKAPEALISIKKDVSQNIFTWHKAHQNKIDTISTTNSPPSLLHVATKQIREFADFGKQVFKQNITFGEPVSIIKESEIVPVEMNIVCKENMPFNNVSTNEQSLVSDSPTDAVLCELGAEKENEGEKNNKEIVAPSLVQNELQEQTMQLTECLRKL